MAGRPQTVKEELGPLQENNGAPRFFRTGTASGDANGVWRNSGRLRTEKAIYSTCRETGDRRS